MKPLVSDHQQLGEEIRNQVNEALDVLMATGVEIFSGYLTDNRNTDNAWVESALLAYHDEDGILSKIDLKPKKGADYRVDWIAVHKSLAMRAGHSALIQAVCWS